MPAANSMAMKRETLNLRIKPCRARSYRSSGESQRETAQTLCWKLPALPQRKRLSNNASLWPIQRLIRVSRSFGSNTFT